MTGVLYFCQTRGICRAQGMDTVNMHIFTKLKFCTNDIYILKAHPRRQIYPHLLVYSTCSIIFKLTYFCACIPLSEMYNKNYVLPKFYMFTVNSPEI